MRHPLLQEQRGQLTVAIRLPDRNLPATMNTKRWTTRRRVTYLRKRRQFNFNRYNRQIPLPFPDPIQTGALNPRERFDEYD